MFWKTTNDSTFVNIIYIGFLFMLLPWGGDTIFHILSIIMEIAFAVCPVA